MKAKLIYIIILLFLTSHHFAHAQCPTFSWANASGASDKNDIGQAIAIDTINNHIFVTGHYYDSGTFGGKNYPSYGQKDVFIAKLDLNGKYIWLKQGGSGYDDEGKDIAVDQLGNVYACGTMEARAAFGEDTTAAAGSYLVKYNAAGQLQWLKDYKLAISALTIDLDNNLLICGDFSGKKAFEGDSIEAIGLKDIFLAKFNPSGQLLWKKYYGSPKIEYAYDVLVDKNNVVYVGGYFYDSLLIESNLLTTNGATDMYIAQFDPQGNLKQVKQLGGNSADGFIQFAIDSENNLLLIGGYYYETLLDTLKVNPIVDDYNQFVAKFDSNMRIKWVYTHNGRTSGIAIAPNDDILVTGYFTNKLYHNHPSYLTSAGYGDLVLFNMSKEGKLNYVKQAGGVEEDRGHAVIAHPNGDYFITGEFSGTAYFSDIELIATPGPGVWAVADVLIAKLENQFLQIDAGSDTSITCNQSVQLNASSNLAVTSYSWYPSSGLSNPIIANPIASPSVTTNYRLIATDVCSKKDTDYVKVTVIKLNATANAGIDQDIECGDSALIGMSDGKNVVSFQWIPETGLVNPKALQTMAHPDQTSTYTLSMEDGCGNKTSDEVLVEVERTSHFSYSMNGLEVSFNLLNTKCSSFNWDFGNGVTSQTETTPTIAFASSGTYTVCLSCGAQPISCQTCTQISLPGNGSGNTSGLIENSRQNVVVYPNPTNSVLFFSEVIDEIKLLSIEGKILHYQLLKANRYEIPNHVDEGLYFIEMIEQGNIKTAKFLYVK
ncbi:MAG: T9SS type A sorting domain-containing protein [Bacteroidetes bacterium]|nr:T9SS type A sorting domain-containing protein [Bacteroidota bacterium]